MDRKAEMEAETEREIYMKRDGEAEEEQMGTWRKQTIMWEPAVRSEERHSRLLGGGHRVEAPVRVSC